MSRFPAGTRLSHPGQNLYATPPRRRAFEQTIRTTLFTCAAGQLAIKTSFLLAVALIAGGKSTSIKTGLTLPMKRSAAVLFVLWIAVAMAARAQVAESATVRTFTI